MLFLHALGPLCGPPSENAEDRIYHEASFSAADFEQKAGFVFLLCFLLASVLFLEEDRQREVFVLTACPLETIRAQLA